MRKNEVLQRFWCVEAAYTPLHVDFDGAMAIYDSKVIRNGIGVISNDLGVDQMAKINGHMATGLREKVATTNDEAPTIQKVPLS